MISSRAKIAVPTLLFLLATSVATAAQSTNAMKPGVKDVQVPFASLKPSVTLKIGKTADWVLATNDAVWVTGTKPYSVQRIDPSTDRIVDKIVLPGEACSGLAFGFSSLWIPVCGKKPTLIRVDAEKNAVIATLPEPAIEAEGGIATSTDSVWLVTDKDSTLSRIDPVTNSVRQKISIPPGSYNPVFSDGVVWVTGVERSVVTAVDASTGSVLDSVPVGSKPRFLTAGGGSIWTLNQGDGTVSRVDEKSRKVLASIQAGIPGTGGTSIMGQIPSGSQCLMFLLPALTRTRIESLSSGSAKEETPCALVSVHSG